MSAVKITTNGHVRNVITWFDLTPEEKEEHPMEYLNEWERNGERLFRYRGWVYDAYEFEHNKNDSELGKLGWSYVQGDTFWSATVFRWVADDYGYEYRVVVGSAYWQD